MAMCATCKDVQVGRSEKCLRCGAPLCPNCECRTCHPAMHGAPVATKKAKGYDSVQLPIVGAWGLG